MIILHPRNLVAVFNAEGQKAGSYIWGNVAGLPTPAQHLIKLVSVGKIIDWTFNGSELVGDSKSFHVRLLAETYIGDDHDFLIGDVIHVDVKLLKEALERTRHKIRELREEGSWFRKQEFRGPTPVADPKISKSRLYRIAAWELVAAEMSSEQLVISKRTKFPKSKRTKQKGNNHGK